jgi:hypothetical protein
VNIDAANITFDNLNFIVATTRRRLLIDVTRQLHHAQLPCDGGDGTYQAVRFTSPTLAPAGASSQLHLPRADHGRRRGRCSLHRPDGGDDVS